MGCLFFHFLNLKQFLAKILLFHKYLPITYTKLGHQAWCPETPRYYVIPLKSVKGIIFEYTNKSVGEMYRSYGHAALTLLFVIVFTILFYHQLIPCRSKKW